MSIFEYREYRLFLRELIRSMPKNGFGQQQKMAAHLGTNSVVISQVLRGTRSLTLDQACSLSSYLGLSKLEREYFLLLVQLDRAGTHQLKSVITEQLEETRERSRQLKSRIRQDKILSEESKAIFYSDWRYSGVRLLSSIPEFDNLDAIAARFQLPRSKVKQILEFLIAQGLCKEDGGKVQMGARSTHLEADSPFIVRQHTNWRLKGIEKMERVEDDELFYTSPMSLSREAVARIRSDLVKLIEGASKIVRDAECETLACLNIDWFKF